MVDSTIPEVLRIGPGFMVVEADELYGAALNDSKMVDRLLRRIADYEKSRSH